MRPAAPQEFPTDEERRLLELRAERVRQKARADAEEGRFWVAEFPVGAERYAVPLLSLRGAVPLRLVTPVPLAPPDVVGVFRHQGKNLTALSLASLLGGSGWKQDPTVLLLVERGDGGIVALDCEQVPRATALRAASVEAARSAAGGAWAEVLDDDRRLVRLIDVRRLLARRGGAR